MLISTMHRVSVVLLVASLALISVAGTRAVAQGSSGSPSPASPSLSAPPQSPANPPAPAASANSSGSSSSAADAKTRGYSIFVCGHSFHQFIGAPLQRLAFEAGFHDHITRGKQFMGGSHPYQIWDLPDDKNPTRAALRQGNVDILTLSPHIKLPDRGIDKYSDFAFQYNPNVRVMLQISWPPNPASPSTNWSQIGMLYAVYMSMANAQVKEINERHGKEYVSIVPVAMAVFKAREEILAGRVPGIKDFKQLFSDEMGHATKPLENLVTFCWFSAIYNKSPEGLTALDSPATSTSAATNRALQKIAWDVISASKKKTAPGTGAGPSGTPAANGKKAGKPSSLEVMADLAKAALVPSLR